MRYFASILNIAIKPNVNPNPKLDCIRGSDNGEFAG